VNEESEEDEEEGDGSLLIEDEFVKEERMSSILFKNK